MNDDGSYGQADFEDVDFIAEQCYEAWRRHFDLAAHWTDLNQERRDGWRAVAKMRVRAEAKCR